MTGLAPLMAGEIASTARLLGVTLTPWEVETIFALDLTARRVLAPPKERGK